MTQTPFASPFAALEHWARRDAGREAVAFPGAGRRVTFGQWRDAAAALARALLDRGVAPGDPVAVLAENRAEWLLVQLGVAAMGGVLVPLNTHLRRDDLAFALRGSGVRVLFASPRFRSNEYLEMVGDIRDGLPDLQLVVPLDPDGAGPDLDALLDEGRAGATPLPDVDAGQIGSLQYTSGTTGTPKGALLTHRGMMENAWQSGRRLRLGPGDRYTSIIPLFHCAGCIMGRARLLANRGRLRRGAGLRRGRDVPGHRGRAVHGAVRGADLLPGDAEPPGAGALRPVIAADGDLRRPRTRTRRCSPPAPPGSRSRGWCRFMAKRSPAR